MYICKWQNVILLIIFITKIIYYYLNYLNATLVITENPTTTLCTSIISKEHDKLFISVRDGITSSSFVNVHLLFFVRRKAYALLCIECNAVCVLFLWRSITVPWDVALSGNFRVSDYHIPVRHIAVHMLITLRMIWLFVQFSPRLSANLQQIVPVTVILTCHLSFFLTLGGKIVSASMHTMPVILPNNKSMHRTYSITIRLLKGYFCYCVFITNYFVHICCPHST